MSAPKGSASHSGQDRWSKADPGALRSEFLLGLLPSLPSAFIQTTPWLRQVLCPVHTFQAPGCGLLLAFMLLPQPPRALVHVCKHSLPFPTVSVASVLSPSGQPGEGAQEAEPVCPHSTVSSWTLASPLQGWTPGQWLLQPPRCRGVCRPSWPLWPRPWSPLLWLSALWVSS